MRCSLARQPAAPKDKPQPMFSPEAQLAEEPASAVAIATRRAIDLKQIAVPDALAAAAPMSSHLPLGQTKPLRQLTRSKVLEGCVGSWGRNPGLRKSDQLRRRARLGRIRPLDHWRSHCASSRLYRLILFASPTRDSPSSFAALLWFQRCRERTSLTTCFSRHSTFSFNVVPCTE